MATTIKLKTGSGAPLNTDLVQGEPAIDLTNKRLYTEDGTDTVIEIGTNPTEVTTGDLTATGTVDLSSATVSNGGTVTTVDIDGGTIDETVIGATTAAAGTFTDLTADTSLTAATADIDGGTIDDTAIGATTASTGAFTTLSASTSLTAAGLSYPTSDGTSGQVLSTDGAGTLSFSTIDTQASKVLVDFTASGSITAGQPLMLKDDGTVTAITGTNPAPYSSFVVDTATVRKVVYDTNANKAVAVYEDSANSGYLYAVVMTMSGTNGDTITFGTPVQINASSANTVDAVFDSTNNKVVVAQYKDVDEISFFVGTVSGTSISFGTVVDVTMPNSGLNDISLTFDPTQGSVVCAAGVYVYGSPLGTIYGYVFAGQVSGTSISFGTVVEAKNTASFGGPAVHVEHYGSSKTLLNFGDAASYNSYFIITTSGTTVTASSETTGSSLGLGFNAVNCSTYDSTNAKIIAQIGSYVHWLSISGSVISASTTGAAASFNDLVYDANLNKTIGFNADDMYQLGVSGSSVSISDPYDVLGFSSTLQYGFYDPDNADVFFVFTKQSDTPEYVVRASYPATTFDSGNGGLIGIAQESVSGGEVVSVMVLGVDENQTGLTIGDLYSIQHDGTFTNDTALWVPNAGDFRAIAATKLLKS